MDTNKNNTGNTSVVRIQGKVVQNCDVYIGRACYKGGWELNH